MTEMAAMSVCHLLFPLSLSLSLCQSLPPGPATATYSTSTSSHGHQAGQSSAPSMMQSGPTSKHSLTSVSGQGAPSQYPGHMNAFNEASKERLLMR